MGTFGARVEVYPGSKILQADELKALCQQLGDWSQVAGPIGANEAWAFRIGIWSVRKCHLGGHDCDHYLIFR